MTEAVHNEQDEFHQYMQKRIADGFISKNGQPIKCDHCGGTEFKRVNEDCISYNLCEYDELCASCGKHVGHWAYGNWMI